MPKLGIGLRDRFWTQSPWGLFSILRPAIALRGVLLWNVVVLPAVVLAMLDTEDALLKYSTAVPAGLLLLRWGLCLLLDQRVRSRWVRSDAHFHDGVVGVWSLVVMGSLSSAFGAVSVAQLLCREVVDETVSLKLSVACTVLVTGGVALIARMRRVQPEVGGAQAEPTLGPR